MNVLITALGSHGDVHPFLGIAKALQARGHRVTFFANDLYAPLAAGEGLEFVSLGTAEDFLNSARDPAIWRPLKGIGRIGKLTARLIQPCYEATLEYAIPGETVLVYSTLGFGVRIAQETLRLPGVSVHLQPLAFRSVIDQAPSTGMPWLDFLPRRVRQALITAGDRVFVEPVFARPINEFRARLKLPPVSKILWRWCHSPLRTIGLFPEWYAPRQPDWPPQAVQTGFMLYDEKNVTPLAPELERFLANGSAPIVFTPGSAMFFGQRFFAAAVDACRRLGRRGVLLTRHDGHVPANLPGEVIHVPFAPFSKLLPRAAAVVHHGGIGSTAQGLACGVPQLLMPMGFDQPDNAARIKRLGVGDWLSPRKFTGPRAAEKLKALIDSPAVRAACRGVAAKFANQEDPAIQTARYIEEVFPRAGSLVPAPGIPGEGEGGGLRS